MNPPPGSAMIYHAANAHAHRGHPGCGLPRRGRNRLSKKPVNSRGQRRAKSNGARRIPRSKKWQSSAKTDAPKNGGGSVQSTRGLIRRDRYHYRIDSLSHLAGGISPQSAARPAPILGGDSIRPSERVIRKYPHPSLRFGFVNQRHCPAGSSPLGKLYLKYHGCTKLYSPRKANKA